MTDQQTDGNKVIDLTKRRKKAKELPKIQGDEKPKWWQEIPILYVGKILCGTGTVVFLILAAFFLGAEVYRQSTVMLAIAFSLLFLFWVFEREHRLMIQKEYDLSVRGYDLYNTD